MDTFKKTLITGGTGYIGSKLINFFLKSNHEFVVLTKSKVTSEKNYFYLEDLNKIPEEAFDGVDRVIHLAGISKDINKRDEKTIKKYTDANIKYVENILNLSIQKKVRSFNFISSTKVNDLNLNFSDDNLKIQRSIYSYTKGEAEKLVKKLSYDYPIKSNIFRLSIVYGPESPGNLRYLINLLKMGFRPCFLFLSNKKSLVHVDDVVRAIDFLSINGKKGEIYNVSGHDYELNQLTKIIAEVNCKKYINFVVPKIIFNLLSIFIYPKKDFFLRLKSEEIYPSKKLKNLGFNFSKNLYDINQSDF